MFIVSTIHVSIAVNEPFAVLDVQKMFGTRAPQAFTCPNLVNNIVRRDVVHLRSFVRCNHSTRYAVKCLRNNEPELICSKSEDLLPPKGRPASLPQQKVLYVNILPGYDSDMYLGFTKLRDLVKQYYPASSVDVRIDSGSSTHSQQFYALTPSASILPNLDGYTQIWVADLAPYGDNSATQMASYQKIANWYKGQGTYVVNEFTTLPFDSPHLILDGRWISSLWSVSVYGANSFRPNIKLIENYFVNLAVRGGGLALLTDHANDFTRGINEINNFINIGGFYGTCTS